ncbi:MAG: SUMF1/EgtB/PvdO family nonheme iron enzyme [Caldilineaceae bacterium]
MGATGGKRLYERLRSDERLYDLAHLPLFLWMFKETAGNAEGDLPADRGSLLRSFVRAPRLLGAIPATLRTQAERVLEAAGWAMQQAGALEMDEDDLYAQLEAVQGRRRFDPDELRERLQETGLLIARGEGRYALLHQLVQEYAAAHLIRQRDCAQQLAALARHEWQRECVILALWLQEALHTPAHLLGLMNDPAIDLRVRVAAATILGRSGDLRFAPQSPLSTGWRGAGLRRELSRTGEAPAFILPPMVAIPGGTALLGGDDPDGYDDEKPACEVEIAPFELAVYPVTNGEFACFINAGGYDDESLWTPLGQAWLRGEGKLDAESEAQYRNQYRAIANNVEGYIESVKRTQSVTEEEADGLRQIAAMSEDEFVNSYAQQVLGEVRWEPFWWQDSRYNQPTLPVVGVNWYEAMAYAAWLSQVTGQSYVLPSEAEWEWAARRRSPQERGRRYPWGDDWDAERCNSLAARLNAPNPVGVYPHGTTPDGLHELAGNVYEWTRSLYRPYPYDPAMCEDDAADGLRVYRGGSWYVGPERVRCAYRGRNNPGHWNSSAGFRLARTSL